jgi:hypothetical protein
MLGFGDYNKVSTWEYSALICYYFIKCDNFYLEKYERLLQRT